MSALHYLFLDIFHELRSLCSYPGIISTLTQFLLFYPAFMALLWIALGACYVFLKEWRLPSHADFKPTVAVIVPAHNEEVVISRTLDSLLSQNYPHLEIHVVSDGSTDRTLEIARSYRHRGVIVHELGTNGGKNGALRHALPLVRSDLFLIVDADTQAEVDAVSYMVQQFVDERVSAVTGGIRVQNVSTLLTAIQSMEYAVIVSLAKRADQFWGGLYTVSGAAACFRTSTLRAVGGWNASTATEDIEISWRMQKAGFRLAYEPRAVFCVQVPTSFCALCRQRTRWSQGMTEVLRLHGDLWRSRNSALLPIAAQCIATGVWTALVCLVLLAVVYQVGTGGLQLGLYFSALYRNGLRAAINWTCGLFVMQTFVAGLIEGPRRRHSYWVYGLAFLYPFYYWSVTFPCFIVGSVRSFTTHCPEEWSRTERTSAH